MSPRRLFAMVCVGLLFTVACGDDTETSSGVTEPTNEPYDLEDVGSEQGFCGHLSPGEIEDATGVGVDEAIPQDEGCTWRLSESAAVIEGPNEGGDARLIGSVVDTAAFEAARSEAETGVDPVEDVGDEAFVVREQQNGTETTLYVADGDEHFRLTLEFVLDGRNARQTALRQLARLVVDAQ